MMMMAGTMMTKNSSEVLGERLMRELEVTSLEDVLKDVRSRITSVNTSKRNTGIPELDDIWTRHGGSLSITGRALPLVYHMINNWVTKCNGTVAVIDLEGRFLASGLNCELEHVHVWRATKGNLKATLEGLDNYMVWGDHRSHGREWTATIVLGGAGGDVMTGWRGWLDVQKDATNGFAVGVSVEEAMQERDRRQEIVDTKGWRAVCELGEFTWN